MSDSWFKCPYCEGPVKTLSISCGADPHREYYCDSPTKCGWVGRYPTPGYEL